MINFDQYHRKYSPETWETKPRRERLERCKICDEPTGRAGVGEDSICRVMKWSVDFDATGLITKGTELFGICEECLDIIESYSEEI